MNKSILIGIALAVMSVAIPVSAQKACGGK